MFRLGWDLAAVYCLRYDKKGDPEVEPGGRLLIKSGIEGEDARIIKNAANSIKRSINARSFLIGCIDYRIEGCLFIGQPARWLWAVADFILAIAPLLFAPLSCRMIAW